jgi:probable phosphoglycerate mutase
MAIYLIRHGETAANAARILQTPDVPLSERGLAQARRLGARLREEGVAGILASDLRRAAMTAEVLRDALGAPITWEPLLHERSFGDLRGTPYVELESDPFAPGFVPPGGESWEVFHARVDRAWSRVVEAASETVGHLAVVTHGLVCRSVVSRLVEVAEGVSPLGYGWRNTSLTVVDGPEPWRVRLLDCARHLEGLEEAAPTQGGAA